MFIEYVLYLFPVTRRKGLRNAPAEKRSVYHWQTGQIMQIFSLPVEAVFRHVSFAGNIIKRFRAGGCSFGGSHRKHFIKKSFRFKSQEGILKFDL